MAGLVVVEGASCRCSCGSANAELVVTSQFSRMIDGLLVATIMDFAPYANMATFGTCDVLTAEASGVTTPCAPAMCDPWAPGSAEMHINGLSVLTMPAECVCPIGGDITIVDSGQEAAIDA